MAKNMTRYEELIEVAIDLFAANGYAGTSIRDIANTTGHSVSNVYHYFENKEALWVAILEYSVKDLPEILRNAAKEPGTALTQFSNMVKTHLAESARHHREIKIFFIEEERLSARGKQTNKRIQKEIFDIYMRQIKVMQAEGIIESRNLRVLTFNILAVINWYLRWHNRVPEMKNNDVHDEIITFILGGIAGQQAQGKKK